MSRKCVLAYLHQVNGVSGGLVEILFSFSVCLCVCLCTADRSIQPI